MVKTQTYAKSLGSVSDHDHKEIQKASILFRSKLRLLKISLVNLKWHFFLFFLIFFMYFCSEVLFHEMPSFIKL